MWTGQAEIDISGDLRAVAREHGIEDAQLCIAPEGTHGALLMRGANISPTAAEALAAALTATGVLPAVNVEIVRSLDQLL